MIEYQLINWLLPFSPSLLPLFSPTLIFLICSAIITVSPFFLSSSWSFPLKYINFVSKHLNYHKYAPRKTPNHPFTEVTFLSLCQYSPVKISHIHSTSRTDLLCSLLTPKSTYVNGKCTSIRKQYTQNQITQFCYR